ncbi:MAG: hypothetical protein RL641_33 [Candidatus Parcubacteria bacterium]
MKKISRQNAEQYWWYRMVKILFILLVIVAGYITFEITKDNRYGQFPRTDFYASRYGYECTKGSSFSGGNFTASNVVFDEEKGKDQVYTLEPVFAVDLSRLVSSLYNMSPDEMFLKICLAGKAPSTPGEWATMADSPIPNDAQASYRFVMNNEVKDKTWGEFLKQWVTVMIVGAIVIVGIPKVFGYIVFGKQSYNAKHEDNIE